ncbi:MAG: hypothetical protein ACOC3V_00900 [bacterium]
MSKLLYGLLTIYSAVMAYGIVKNLKNNYSSKINNKIVLKDDTDYIKRKVSSNLIKRVELFKN